MKSGVIAACCMFYCLSVSAQKQEIENIALQQVLGNKKSYRLDSVKIYLNRYTEEAPSIKFFSGQNGWHVNGILKQNCYSENDSLSNINVESCLLVSKDKYVKLGVRKTPPKNIPSICVYKRFYYCNKIYVLIWIKYDECFFTQVLVTFAKDGSLISTDSISYIT